MSRRSRSSRGFTLTEVMVVVVIVGVLVSMAFVYLQPKTRTIDVANRIGDLVREASRRAVTLGPVRADVATAYTKARMRVRGTASGPQPTFLLERMQENALGDPPSWIPVLQYIVNKDSIGESWGSGVGSHSALTLSTDWTAFEAKCYPDGTCDAKTLFFEATAAGAPADRYARISIMPIGGAIMTRRDWN